MNNFLKEILPAIILMNVQLPKTFLLCYLFGSMTTSFNTVAMLT